MPTGSENIDIAPGSKLKRDVHLLVLIHGMWGNPNHLSEVNRIIKEVKGRRKDVVQEGDTELEVLVAQREVRFEEDLDFPEIREWEERLEEIH